VNARGVPYLTPAEIAEIEALPALAIALPRRTIGGSWHAVVRYKPRRETFQSGWCTLTRGYVSDPDFSTHGYGATALEAAEGVKRAVIEDLKGTGNRYAPHWDSYDMRYRILPHWKQIAPAVLRAMGRHGRVPTYAEQAATMCQHPGHVYGPRDCPGCNEKEPK
jgi:hypothetical protein